MMADSSPPKTPDAVGAATRLALPRRTWLADWFTLRKPGPMWESFLLGAVCIGLCFAVWWLVTRGAGEQRIVGPLTLPSPEETFRVTPELFSKDLDIISNTLVTLRRVGLGFLLALVVGVPLGILAGCFPRVNAFLSPLVIFGRNIPLAAVLSILFFMFSGEQRKVVFIFVACVAFIIADTAQAIMDVAERYVDTAYTLGASRWQTIIKVLVPLAMPAIFGSFRVLFGLAFGYIMLAESIREPGAFGGLGFQISTFQHRGPREGIYLIILIIPLVALAIDLILFWIQRQLFPHVYGGSGWLQRGLRLCLHGWDDLKRFFFRYEPPQVTAAIQAPSDK
jgi:ABC-type nitrate/sulfonate/bicarbonate transport system permease component